MLTLKELQSRVAGTVTSSTDKDYESLRAMGWNRLVPNRRPRLIVQVADEKDVVEAVRFARANQMKVAVRGGGHSWVSFALRDDSLLIDLGRLKQASIDREARRAVVQPAITGRELNGHSMRCFANLCDYSLAAIGGTPSGRLVRCRTSSCNRQ